MYVLLISCS